MTVIIVVAGRGVTAAFSGRPAAVTVTDSST